ncbi:MAG: Uma2 family endonuclease [Pseudomonadota bacterium]
MSEVIDFEDEVLEDEESDMGSINHSLAQARLTSLLDDDERFAVLTELSLDISQRDFSKYGVKAKDEVKPDICLYSNAMDFQDLDIVKMTDMPLLAIEIISPSQGTRELKGKIYAYFELGVKSCWLVVPDARLISVYAKQGDFKNFDMRDDNVIDEVMDIHLPISKVFKKRSNLQEVGYNFKEKQQV